MAENNNIPRLLPSFIESAEVVARAFDGRPDDAAFGEIITRLCAEIRACWAERDAWLAGLELAEAQVTGVDFRTPEWWAKYNAYVVGRDTEFQAQRERKHL